MGRLGNMISVMIGINLLFYLFGLLNNTFTSEIMDLALNPTNFSASPIKYALIALLVAAVAITVASAIFNLRVDLTALAQGTFISGILLNIFVDFVNVMSVVYAINSVVAILVFGSLGILYVMTVIEWWRGVTT